ncbi:MULTISPECIES: ABC transporter substrate-binding protein [Actinosynnema]|uniref:ABC transporter substrate-binding protein n=1 Tax=Actinosynnema TaxID=40566 RepID=UPI0020A3104C|nr:ABC transporter substrate-binding protein [Actinosynnema pretiosum]MCP2098867.1 iron complex transport system substrate-binding protein [Actinosynnema pretiosum]
MTRRLSAAPLSATAALALLAACSSQASPTAGREPTAAPASATASATTYPLTIDNCGTQITFTKAPSRVLLLNGASVAEAESLVALGLSDRVVANSQSYGVSDEPGMVEKVAALPTGGVSLNDNFEVPREQVIDLKPDLVISTWAGGFDDRIGSITRDQLAEAGINSLVTPANCANGATDPRPQDTEAYEKQSVESSYELLMTLGQVFDVQQKAADLVDTGRERVAAAAAKAEGEEPKSVLVVYPGMSTMTTTGAPAVFGGGIYDDIIAKAGGKNAFAGKSNAELAEVNVEALASADVDLLVVGLYQPGEDGPELAEELFAKYPAWKASASKRYVTVSDSPYLGPLNAIAVEKLATALHG